MLDELDDDELGLACKSDVSKLTKRACVVSEQKQRITSETPTTTTPTTSMRIYTYALVNCVHFLHHGLCNISAFFFSENFQSSAGSCGLRRRFEYCFEPEDVNCVRVAWLARMFALYTEGVGFDP